MASPAAMTPRARTTRQPAAATAVQLAASTIAASGVMSDIYALHLLDVNSLCLLVFTCGRDFDARLTAVRWARLFADLEAQLDAAEDAEFASEVADRSRREIALTTLTDRIRSVSGDIQMGLGAGEVVRGRVVGCGPGWVLLADAGVETLVALRAVGWIRGLSIAAETSTSVVTARLDLGYALRGIARDRAPTVIVLVNGDRLSGTVDRVGADFVDVAEHPVDQPRRSGAVQSTRTIPLASLAAVRRQ